MKQNTTSPESEKQTIRSFVHGSSTKCPRYDLIPRHPLTRLAARCEEGVVNHGDKAWNARNNPAALTEKEWIIERLNHVVNHTLELIHQLTHDLPVDGDDNASAIMWGGMLACEVTKDGNPFLAPANTVDRIYNTPAYDVALPGLEKPEPVKIDPNVHFDTEWGGDNETELSEQVASVSKPKLPSFFVGDYVRWSEHPKEGPWYYGTVDKQSLGSNVMVQVKERLTNSTRYIGKKSKTIEKINKETYDVGGSYEEVVCDGVIEKGGIDNSSCTTNRCAYRLGHTGECGDSYGNRL